MTDETPTVFVVDDNAAVRSSLRELVMSACLAVETFASGGAFLDCYRADRAGCLVLDVRLAEGSGLDLQDELQRRGVTLPIIILTGHGNVPTAVRAMKAGAFDFLQKPPPPALLLERINAAIEVDRATRATARARIDARVRLASLTPRERDVMALIVAGASSKEAASDLFISVRTVEGHRRRVLYKLNVTSAARLVRVVMDTHGAQAHC